MLPQRSAVQFILTKVLACYLAVTGFVLCVFITWSYQQYQENRQHVVQQLRSSVETVIEQTPDNIDQLLASLTLGTQFFSRDFASVESFALLDEDGSIVFSWPNQAQLEATDSSLFQLLAIQNSSFTLALAFPKWPLYQVVINNLPTAMGILLLQFVLLLAVLAVVIKRGVRSGFEGFMRELSLVCLERPTPLQAHSFPGQFGEYRQILDGINRVILSLAKSREEFSNINKSLESHIKAKTAALEERNQELVDLNQQLSVIANTDALTQVYNRTRFDVLFLEYVMLARRRVTPLSLLLVDLDDFKKVNDRFGHQTGDLVLKHAAQVIHKEVGEEGVVARWGGEEFAVLLPYFDLISAERKAESLRAVLAEAHFEEQSIQVTTSIGVAQLSSIETGPELLKRADDALYDAKGSGRNRVIIAYVEESHAQLDSDSLMEGEFIEVFDVEPVPIQDEPKASQKHSS